MDKQWKKRFKLILKFIAFGASDETHKQRTKTPFNFFKYYSDLVNLHFKQQKLTVKDQPIQNFVD